MGEQERRPGVIAVGRSALDYVYRIERFPERPQKVMALEHRTSPGGMAANAATAIARLGGDVELWSRLGDDKAGQQILNGLADEGINTSYVRIFPNAPTATAVIIVDQRGERLIVGEPGLKLPMQAGWLPLSRIRSGDVVFSDLNWREATRAAFQEARLKGATTVLDMDIGVGSLMEDIMRLTDYAILSESALDTFLEGLSTDERLEGVLKFGVRHAGVTLGKNGYRWKTKQGECRTQPALPVDVVDTTGAGDAFHGAFAWSLAARLDDGEAARIATGVAALSCRRLGARDGLPSLPELNAFLVATTGHGSPFKPAKADTQP